MGFFKDLKKRAKSIQPMPAPIPQEMSLPSIKPGVLDKRISSALPQRPSPIPQGMSLNPISIPSFKLEKRISDIPPPARLSEITENIGNRPRRLPQIIPERMPSPRPTPRFFGGGLGNIFARLPQFMERFEDQRVRERMSPPLPRAPLPMPMPEDMPRERFPMMRPGFAEGEGVDINRIIADQAAREGISPAERKAQSLKNFLSESGRIISDRDADLYGMGILSFEDVMRRAESARQTDLANEQRRNAIADQGRTISNMDRNLMQQEQMFFPDSGRTISNMDMNSLDDILADLEKKN